MKPFWWKLTLSGMTSLLQAVLLFYAFSATASFRSPRVVNPYTNTSPSGRFICEVDPSDIYGRGEAKYRLVQDGSVIWEGVKPFTLVCSAVTDEGVVAGYGYTYGENGTSERGYKAGVGDFVIAMVEPTGRLRVHESVTRERSGFLHDLPNPLARGIILDGPGNRFIVRVRDPDLNRSKESWWVYEIASGKSLGKIELSAGDGGTASPIRAVSIKGTPLILVQYWRYEHPDSNARFALLDSALKEIWSVTWRRDYNIEGDEAAQDRLRNKIWAESAILDAGKSNRFVLFSAKRSEAVSFTVQPDKGDDDRWQVTELERKKHTPTPDTVEEPLPFKREALKFLGSFSLDDSHPMEEEVFRNVIGFGFDGSGRVNLLRRGKNDEYRLALVETNGQLIREVTLPKLARPNLTQVRFAWTAKDRWIIMLSELGPEKKTFAWWLNAPAGELKALSGFTAPAVESVAGTADGGFVALCTHRYKYTMEDELIAFDQFGKVRWRVKQDYQNEQALFSPEDITFTTHGQVAVLDKIRRSIQYFDINGAFIKSIDLEKSWARKPNYPTEISPEPDGGVLVHDFQGSPPVVRMNPEGKVVSQFSLKHADGRAIDPTYGVRVSPTGRVWACDGASLVRVTEEGVADLVLGSMPGSATLGRIACLTVDQNGKLYAADERSGEVHVFDQAGKRLRVCTPLNSDFAKKLIMGDIAVNQQGEVFLSGGNSFPEKATYVHFDPSGARVGAKTLGLDTVRERWYPLPANNRILAVAYQAAFIVGEDGNVQRKIQRRPDGNWLEYPKSASIAPDGSFAIVSGNSLGGPRFFVNLYSADGEPIRTIVLPTNCVEHCFAYTGKYLVTCTESAICLFTSLGEPVLSFEYPLEKLNSHWSSYSTKNGRELWLVSEWFKKVCRFELP
ncbi:MAG TPA: hypothetical protein VN673_14310 [Clostridia bacterium]|nr:hypothetical protein [Clostridia bacterium]